MNIIGNNIKHYRKLMGITQNELSEMLNISEQFMGFLEQGRNKPSIDLLIQLSEIMKIPLSYFISESACGDKAYSNYVNAEYINSMTDSELDDSLSLLKLLYEHYCGKG